MAYDARRSDDLAALLSEHEARLHQVEQRWSTDGGTGGTGPCWVASDTPPADTSLLWVNTRTTGLYLFLGDAWVQTV